MRFIYWIFAESINLDPLPRTGTGKGNPVETLFNIFLAILGAVAVLMITIAGLRFTLANGDPQTISRAKNTIIYSLIGVVVVISAKIIVNFVFGNL